jgi:uncharacterized protein YjbJ (UPF0337 family)
MFWAFSGYGIGPLLLEPTRLRDLLPDIVFGFVVQWVRRLPSSITFCREPSPRPAVNQTGHAGSKRGFHMSGNTDKAAGMANEAAGKIKQGVGKAVGSEKLQGEGAGQKLKGDAQQVKGDTKNAIKDGVNKLADATNKKF